MSENPIVSVIVPSYCHEAYIFDCLSSIAAQTYPEIELVVVDDRSTDQSYEKLTALFAGDFSKRFRRTVLLQNDVNMGAHATINRGIAASRGSHIAVINSDDLFHPDRIADLMAALAEKGSELAFSLVEVIAEPGVAEIEPFFRMFDLRQFLALERDPTVGFALLRANQAISTGNLLFTRALYEKVGPFGALKYCHDWDFILQSLYWTEPAVVLKKHYFYRLHSANSFSSLAHLAGLESEVVLRRFFRLGLRPSRSPNPLFPSEANWPGYFSLFIKDNYYEYALGREEGYGPKSGRTLEQNPDLGTDEAWILPFHDSRPLHL